MYHKVLFWDCWWFLLYINDIVNSVTKPPCKTMLFADDTNVFIVHKHPIMLKQLAEVIMADLCDWFITNRLTPSLKKTNFNIFHSPRKKYQSCIISWFTNSWFTNKGIIFCLMYLMVILSQEMKFTTYKLVMLSNSI